MLYLLDGMCIYSIYTCRNFLRCTHTLIQTVCIFMCNIRHEVLVV